LILMGFSPNLDYLGFPTESLWEKPKYTTSFQSLA